MWKVIVPTRVGFAIWTMTNSGQFEEVSYNLWHWFMWGKFPTILGFVGPNSPTNLYVFLGIAHNGKSESRLAYVWWLLVVI